jgi:CheY-like chemotaxis protein
VGAGTTFRVEIRLAEAEAAWHEQQQRRVARLALGQPDHRMLVVDDTAENRQILVRLLESVGFEVREACNGAEAIDVWSAWRPDLIWMDLRMTVMGGLEATRRIKARCAEEAGCRAPVIIALTASVFHDDRPAVFEAGCDDLVPKPYRESEIFEKVAEHLGVRFEYETDEADGDALPIETLTSARVASLPAAATEQLRRALMEGDVEAARDAVGRIAPSDPVVAAELESMLKGYRFEHILDLLDGVPSQVGSNT